MTWVKICGMTNLEDALVAVEAGADAVGFVFYEKSPRCVTVERAREICEKLPESVEKIGVFVGRDEEAVDVFLQAGLTGAQSYLSRDGLAGSAARTQGIPKERLPVRGRFMMALPFSLVAEDFGQMERLTVRLAESVKKRPDAISKGILGTFLIDSGSSHCPGGTGRPFAWKAAVSMVETMKQNGMKLVVAGGLTPENVGEAIETLHPWGVDVVSGVEASPGKKDPQKVRAFVRAVREMDRRVG